MEQTQRVFLGGVLVALLVGGGIGWYIGDRRGHAQGMIDGTRVAKEKLERLGILSLPPQKLTSISGKITSVDTKKQRMVVEVAQVITNPLETPAPTSLTILLTRDTAFVARKGEKDRAIRVTDLKAGQTVILEHFEDFLFKTEFEVSRITVVE